MNCLWLLIYLFLALSWPVSDRSRIADNETIIHHTYKTEESSWYVEFWSIITSVYHVANSVCWGMQKLNEDADYKSCILSYVSQQSWKASHYHFSRCLYLYRDQFFFSIFSSIRHFFSTPLPQLRMKWLNCWYAFICLFHILNIFTSSKCEYQNWLEVCNLWKLLHVQKQDAIINIHIYIIIEP